MDHHHHHCSSFFLPLAVDFEPENCVVSSSSSLKETSLLYINYNNQIKKRICVILTREGNAPMFWITVRMNNIRRGVCSTWMYITLLNINIKTKESEQKLVLTGQRTNWVKTFARTCWVNICLCWKQLLHASVTCLWKKN